MSEYETGKDIERLNYRLSVLEQLMNELIQSNQKKEPKNYQEFKKQKEE